MTRLELEHAIRAACDVSGDTEVFVFGSQAILGQYPDAPEALRQSAEADISPVRAVDRIDDIDAALGELSSFHEAYGFFVHGVSIESAVLPAGWRRRAIRVRNQNTRNMTGWCVEAHDLAASKLVAFRDKQRGVTSPAGPAQRQLTMRPYPITVTRSVGGGGQVVSYVTDSACACVVIAIVDWCGDKKCE